MIQHLHHSVLTSSFLFLDFGTEVVSVSFLALSVSTFTLTVFFVAGTRWETTFLCFRFLSPPLFLALLMWGREALLMTCTYPCGVTRTLPCITVVTSSASSISNLTFFLGSFISALEPANKAAVQLLHQTIKVHTVLPKAKRFT